MAKLEGKVVLITGAHGGLGTFVTNSFLEVGARVIAVSRAITDSSSPHPKLSAMAADISTGEAARQLMETAVARSGQLDGLVHLIGGFAGGSPVSETDDATASSPQESAIQILRSSCVILRNKQRRALMPSFGTPRGAVFTTSSTGTLQMGRYVPTGSSRSSCIIPCSRPNVSVKWLRWFSPNCSLRWA